MAFFRTPVVDGAPKFADKPGATCRLSPDGTEAILELKGTPADYAQVSADPDTTELTQLGAQQLAREWDLAIWGSTA